MTRLLIAAIALSFATTSLAQAAPRHQSQQRGVISMPVSLQGAFPTRPAWAAPGDCFTDDGYGRFWPCSAGCRN
jgi:hypothetical protein